MARKRKVYVLGEINVDLIMTGEDVTPEWNREKLVDSFEVAMGSSSVITACGLAGLGLEVFFVGIVGDDEFGHFMIRGLQKAGVNTDGVTVDVRERTGVTLSLSTSKDRALLTYMGSIPNLEPSMFPSELLEKADHIHFGSYYLQHRMQPFWKEWFQRAKEAGVSTSFDTGWDPDQKWHREELMALLPYTSLFIPSEEEILHILGISELDQLLHILRTGETDQAHLPLNRGGIAIKCGSKGSVWLGPDEAPVRYPAFPANVVDTTGAGDSFNAGLIYGYLADMKPPEWLRFANACGALATERIGGVGSTPSLAEVEAYLANH